VDTEIQRWLSAFLAPGGYPDRTLWIPPENRKPQTAEREPGLGAGILAAYRTASGLFPSLLPKCSFMHLRHMAL